jgi:hypothetical protein
LLPGLGIPVANGYKVCEGWRELKEASIDNDGSATLSKNWVQAQEKSQGKKRTGE